MRNVLLLMFATCATVADGLDTMLVQGRADTIRTLRNIVRNSSQRSLDTPKTPWHHSKLTPLKQTDTPEIPSSKISKSRRINKNKNIKYVHKTSRNRRHISHVIVESGQCDHVDLVDCSDYESDEMTCMLTATGMTCCVCTGLLRQAKRTLF